MSRDNEDRQTDSVTGQSWQNKGAERERVDREACRRVENAESTSRERRGRRTGWSHGLKRERNFVLYDMQDNEESVTG